MGVPNNSIVSPAHGGAMAPNSSIVGMPRMNAPLSDDHLAYGLLQEKLYQTLHGRIAPDDTYGDLTLDGNKPHWQAVASLLKAEDQSAHGSLMAPEAELSLDDFRSFVDTFQKA